MNNIAPKLQKYWTHKIAFNIISKMLKQPNFFCSQPSILSKHAPAKFYFSTTFGLSFMISSVALTLSDSTLYAYLITKIRNRNFKGFYSLQCPVLHNDESIHHLVNQFLELPSSTSIIKS